MANFVGKYFYEKSEGLEDYIGKIAGPTGAEAAKKFRQNKPYFEVTVSGDCYTFTLYNGEQITTNSFYLKKEFNENTFFSSSLKTICNKYDNIFTFVSKLSNGNTSTREYKFMPEGCECNFSEQQFGVKSTLTFKRSAC